MRGGPVWDSYNVFLKSVTYRPTLSKFRGGAVKKNTLYFANFVNCRSGQGPVGPGDQPGWLYPKNIWLTWPEPSSFWETGRCHAFSWFFETEHVFGWCILGICFNFIYFTHAFWVALQIFAREEVKKEFAIWGGRGVSPTVWKTGSGV